MKENIISELTSKNDKYACALADKIISESRETGRDEESVFYEKIYGNKA